MPRVRKVLKSRSGLCIDYAHLMDTLCGLSGITNVSVYGYAKDEIFDLNDSLYLDNHAWNAVRLDGLWYVYDVTWASGQPEYRFTRSSNFMYKLYLKYPPKYRKIKIREKTGSSIRYCDSTFTDILPELNYYKQKFWNKLLIRLLSKFKLKVTRAVVSKINPDYYLCNPELFAVTHFPDDPVWSLVAGKTIRDFEGDSAYYYFHDSLYKTQQRYGRPCSGCDGYLSYDELNKNVNLRKESLKFNRRNRFVTTLCEYNIGKLKLAESKNFDDSLTKVTVIDTALAWHDRAKASLYQSFLNVEQDFYLQRAKNKAKADVLYAENNAYVNFVLNEKISIHAEATSFKDLEHKTEIMEQKLYRHYGQVHDLDVDIQANDKIKTTPAKKLELEQKLNDTDSLLVLKDLKTDSLKQLLEIKARQLSLNLKEKTLEHDSVFYQFYTSIYLRQYMRDNYKKDVADVRKKIERSKIRYTEGMEEKVYKLSRECAQLGDALFKAMNERIYLENEGFEIRLQMAKRSQIPPEKLREYKALLKRKSREDQCWLFRSKPPLHLAFFMLRKFAEREKDAIYILKKENVIEGSRVKYVGKELGRRKRKYKNIVLHNTKAVNYELRLTRKEKRDFLKKLRDERREAARNSK